MVALTPEQQSRIEKAIAQAETTTEGEIAVVIAPQSGDWRAASLALSITVAVLCSLLLWLARPEWPFLWLWLSQLIAFLLCETFLSATGLTARLIPAEALHKAARRYAESIFHTHAITATPTRSGILIFLSLAERSAFLIADNGIRDKEPENVWQKMVDDLVHSIRTGHMAGGLESTVIRCGEKLAAHFPATSQNPNHLPDLVQL